MPLLQIFTAGVRTDANGVTVDFNESTLAKIAAIYDPKIHEAPLTIGHPKHDDPAYGWVSTLIVQGNQLLAEPNQVDPEFAESVESGRYKKISASFYLPGSPHHPIPEADVPYVRHVGFLGGMPPAVKGMAPVNFAEAEEGVFYCEFDDEIVSFTNQISRMFGGLRDWLIEEKDLETADRLLPSYSIDSLKELAVRMWTKHLDDRALTPIYSEETKTPMSDPNLEQRERDIAAREQKLLQREAADFCEGLIREGRGEIAGVKAKAVALLSTLPEADSLQFGEGDDTGAASTRAMVKDILAAFPKTVVFGEMAAPDQKTEKKGNLMSIAKKIQAEAKANGEEMDWPSAVRKASEQLGMKDEGDA
jgi:hypothetical protein